MVEAASMKEKILGKLEMVQMLMEWLKSKGEEGKQQTGWDIEEESEQFVREQLESAYDLLYQQLDSITYYSIKEDAFYSSVNQLPRKYKEMIIKVVNIHIK